MKKELSADCVSDIIPFKAATIEALEHTDDTQTTISTIIGRINKTGKWAWLARGGVLEIVSTVTGERWASWCFGAVVKDPQCYVTCVTEYHYDGNQKLLVALATHSNQGMVCLFDLKQSKILKTIVLPYKITSIESITTTRASYFSPDVIHELLESFYGIIALGTESGRVFLLDMCLDDDSISNEIASHHVTYLTFKTQDIEKKRVIALRNKEHFCIQLDSESHQYGQFVYRRQDNSIVRSYNSDDVYVSCLKYIRQLGTLAVGFNFGCFQLWSLQTPSLMYCSRFDDVSSLVTHFTFQEPENDPRNCCYLWVGRSSPITDPKPEFCSTISLFQLSFTKKGFEENYGVIYQNLHSCHIRFEHDLTNKMYNFASFSNTVPGSRLIDCYALEDPFNSVNEKLQNFSGEDEGILNSDVSLAVFVWEASSPNPNVESECLLGIFDMNRWYHAQMPSSVSISSNPHEQCPFFSFYSLDDVMVKAEPDFILDVYIPSSSICKYVSINGAEQHLYPSSLAFETCVLLETGLIKASYLGLQRQSLSELHKNGPLGLVTPQDLFNLCLYTGLIPRILEVSVSTVPLSYQREMLLSVALEHNMIDFLTFCIRQWATGEFTSSGCTLRFFLEWAWKKVTSIKSGIDRLCIPLYDCSGIALNQQSIQTLHQYHTQLQHIATLFNVLLNQAAPTTEQGLRDLETKLSVVTLLALHLEVVLWFLACDLLPENNEGDVTNSKMITYPATVLITYYQNKRQELQKLNKVIGETDFLMIDGLTNQIKEQICNLWGKDGGNGLYPPPSLHALLNIYLLENVPIIVKHSIVMYLFFDLLSLLNPLENLQMSENMSFFTIAFQIPPSQARLIQAFWLLDHKAFEEALELLLDSSITFRDIASWQHPRIIKSFIYQCQGRLGLKYIRVRRPALETPERVKLYLTVLLDNGLITEAFEYQRLYRDQVNIEDILQHFFLACQQSKLMDKLLQLPLSELEDEFLIQYLKESTEPHSLEVLVMHYLQRGRFIEAIRLNEKLKSNILNEHNPKTREHAIARNAIIENYVKILPSIQRKLVLEPDRQITRTKVIRKEVREPLPLSTSIHQSLASQAVSQATLIATVMEKVAETYSKPPEDYTPIKQRFNTSFKSRPSPFIGTPITPRLQSQFGNVSDVVYPRISFMDSSQVDQPISPTKKSGYMGIMSPVASSDSIKRRLSKYANAEALSLLRTPSVHRKAKQAISTPQLPDPTQSILKVKQALKQSSSPIKEISQKQSPNKASSNFEMALSGTPKFERQRSSLYGHRPSSLSLTSKQLRFDLPSPESSTSEASSPIVNSLFNASPKPLHESLTMMENGFSDQSMVVDDEIIFTFHKRDQSSPAEVEEIIPPPVHAYVCEESEQKEVTEIIPRPIYTYECGTEDELHDLSFDEIKNDNESDVISLDNPIFTSSSLTSKEKENQFSLEMDDTFLTASSTDSPQSVKQTPPSPGVLTRAQFLAESQLKSFEDSPTLMISHRSQRLGSDMSNQSSEASISLQSEPKKSVKSSTQITIEIMLDKTSDQESILELDNESSDSMKKPLSDSAIFTTPRRSPRNKSSSQSLPDPRKKENSFTDRKTDKASSKENVCELSPKCFRRSTRQHPNITHSDFMNPSSELLKPATPTLEAQSEMELGFPRFTFSNPRILEVVSEVNNDEMTPKSFVFSPPITRSRSRHKKMSEESFNDTSFISAMENDITTSISETKIKILRPRRSPRSKTTISTPSFISESPINFISPIPEEKLYELNTKTSDHRISKSLSHGMNLRKNRGPAKKKRSSKLW